MTVGPCCLVCGCPSLCSSGRVELHSSSVSSARAGTASRSGLLGCLATVAIAFAPMQGRPVIDWVRPLANYLHGRLSGQGPTQVALGRCTSHAGCSGASPSLGLGAGFVFGRSMPHTERSPSSGRAAGGRRLIQVTAPAYPLADRATQQERVSAWGSLLAQLGQEGSRLAAIQWLERTVPDSGRGLEDWWRSKGVRSSVSAAHYEKLIASAGPAATRHETFVAVSIDERRCKRAVRAAGGGPDGIAQVLINELSWVQNGLQRCDVQVVGWLGPVDLGRLVRTQYDPLASQSIDNRSKHGLGRGVRLAAAGPMAAKSTFSHYRTDSGFHAVYWVASWPRMQVQAAWLYPLLVLGDSVERCQSLPNPSHRRSPSVKSGAPRCRNYGGDPARTVRSGRNRRSTTGARRPPAPRARAGAGTCRVPVHRYATVSASTESGLEESCAQIEQAAVRSVLEVRRVFGEQDQAFVAAALPLARGVR